MSLLYEIDPSVLLVVALAFSLGGLIKGMTGFGLHMITVPLLSFSLSLPTAVALIMIPVMLSNAYLIKQSGHAWQSVRRFWSLMGVMVVTLRFTTRLLVTLDQAILTSIFGVVIFIYVLINIRGPRWEITPGAERWLSPLVGLAGGVIGGATSLYGMPVLLYVIALNPPKEQFVAAITVNYLVGGVALAVMLAKLEILTGRDVLIAGIGLVPLFAGVAADQFLRRKSEPGIVPKNCPRDTDLHRPGDDLKKFHLEYFHATGKFSIPPQQRP